MDVEKRGTVHCGCEGKLVQPLWKTVWRFLKKLKIKLPYNSAIPLLSIYPNKTKTLTQNDICTPYVHCSINYNSKIWKQPKCSSTHEWVKKV